MVGYSLCCGDFFRSRLFDWDCLLTCQRLTWCGDLGADRRPQVVNVWYPVLDAEVQPFGWRRHCDVYVEHVVTVQNLRGRILVLIELDGCSYECPSGRNAVQPHLDAVDHGINEPPVAWFVHFLPDGEHDRVTDVVKHSSDGDEHILDVRVRWVTRGPIAP